MFKQLSYIAIPVLLLACGILGALSPDTDTTVFLLVMFGVVAIGIWFGILPVLKMTNGLRTGTEAVLKAGKEQKEQAWIQVLSKPIFQNPVLDTYYIAYSAAVTKQKQDHQMTDDIDTALSPETLDLKISRRIINQIPTTLTGLGILGTFMGLLQGIHGISFQELPEAINSVNILLQGINVAFYTSIAGVVLGLLFNLLYRMLLNAMEAQYDAFIQSFHTWIIPSLSDQKKEMECTTLSRLLTCVQNIEARVGQSANGMTDALDEKTMMQKILEGMRRQEFQITLRPFQNQETHQIEALSGGWLWNSPDGMIREENFLPLMASTGYIIRLDQMMIQQVIRYQAERLQSTAAVPPVLIPLHKQTLMAMDVADNIRQTLRERSVPPKYIKVQIQEALYRQETEAAVALAGELAEAGIDTALCAFDGNLSLLPETGRNINTLILDLSKADRQQLAVILKDTAGQVLKKSMALYVADVRSAREADILSDYHILVEGPYFHAQQFLTIEIG